MSSSLSKSFVQPFLGATYSPRFRPLLHDLAVPMWSAAELWGEKESEFNFRSCLVGDAESCARQWRNWMATGVFSVDTEQSYYVLEHRFRFHDRECARWGVFGSVPVNDSCLKLHEDVFPDGVENTRDRFSRSAADLTPIFVGVEEGAVDDLRHLLQPLVQGKAAKLVYEENAVTKHSLWRVADASALNSIASFFAERNLYLLDGHHRVHGARENFRRGIGDGRLLACICSMASADLQILPIHRAVLCDEWLMPDKALAKLEAWNCDLVNRQRWTKESLPDFVHRESLASNEFWFVPAQSAEIFRYAVPQMKTNLVVEHIEQNLFANFSAASLLPVNDVDFLVEQLARGQAQAGILLSGVAPSVVRNYADAGRLMPRKSTQFFPKPAIGLVCRPW